MSIVLKLDDDTRKSGERRWRQSWLADYDSWLSAYFAREIDPIQKCPHGNGIGLDCTACRPYFVPWNGGCRVPRANVRANPDLTGRQIAFLRHFQRKGGSRIDDHDISPYDSHWRRSGVTEYCGGYLTAGYGDDGVGIRVSKKHGPADDEFEMRWDEFYPHAEREIGLSRSGVFAVMPRPDSECNYLDAFRFATNRATRVIAPLVYHPGPVLLGFEDEPKAKPEALWKPDRKFIHWSKPCPEVLLTWPVSPRWTTLFLRQSVGPPRPIPVSAPWPFQVRPEEDPGPPREWKRRKYGPAVGRKIKTPCGWYSITRKPSTPWPSGWRTERKMRDTSARLKMHDYGAEGLINVPRMNKTAYRNYYEAWKDRSRACGIVARQNFWPCGDTVPRGSREARYGQRDSEKYVTVDKGDPFRRAREIENRRREIPEPHYQAWLGTGEITVYLDCVLPSGCPNVGVVETRKDR